MQPYPLMPLALLVLVFVIMLPWALMIKKEGQGVESVSATLRAPGAAYSVALPCVFALLFSVICAVDPLVVFALDFTALLLVVVTLCNVETDPSHVDKGSHDQISKERAAVLMGVHYVGAALLFAFATAMGFVLVVVEYENLVIAWAAQVALMYNFWGLVVATCKWQGWMDSTSLFERGLLTCALVLVAGTPAATIV